MSRKRNCAGMRAFQCILLVCLPLLAWAAPKSPARVGIESSYARVSEAAELMFVDGIVSVRMPGFSVTAPNGKTMDLSVERGRFRELFNGALQVKMSTDILSIDREDATSAVCTVQHKMVVEKLDPIKREAYTLVFDTRSQDEWKRDKLGWRKWKAHILQETFSKEAGLTGKPKR